MLSKEEKYRSKPACQSDASAAARAGGKGENKRADYLRLDYQDTARNLRRRCCLGVFGDS